MKPKKIKGRENKFMAGNKKSALAVQKRFLQHQKICTKFFNIRIMHLKRNLGSGAALRFQSV